MPLPTVQNNMLYHYCSLEKALKILSKKQLRLGPLINTNDPRENKNLTFGSFSQSALSRPVNDLLDMSREMSNLVRENCKVICFSTDCEPLRGYELEPMWTHYADNHKGVCIGINYEQFIHENSAYIENNLFKYVTYVSRKSLIQTNITDRYISINADRYGNELERTDYLNEFRKQHADYLYFTKSESWDREHEFRLIYFGNCEKDEYCSIEESLSHVFLGLDFAIPLIPELRRAVGNIERPIWEMEYGGEWLYCKRNVNANQKTSMM